MKDKKFVPFPKSLGDDLMTYMAWSDKQIRRAVGIPKMDHEYIFVVDTSNISGYCVSDGDFRDLLYGSYSGYRVSDGDFRNLLYGSFTIKPSDIMKVLYDKIRGHVESVFNDVISRLDNCYIVSRDIHVSRLCYFIRTNYYTVNVLEVYIFENDKADIDYFRREYLNDSEIELPKPLDDILKEINDGS